MKYLFKIAYIKGVADCLEKLGTPAGYITYPSVDKTVAYDDGLDDADAKIEALFDENDREGKLTGEESGIGQPSSKSASAVEPDAYATHSDGLYGTGAGDQNRVRTDRDQRNSDSVSRGFDVNRNLDTDFGMGIPAFTQPTNTKSAASNSLASMQSELRKLQVGLSPTQLTRSFATGDMGTAMKAFKPPAPPKFTPNTNTLNSPSKPSVGSATNMSPHTPTGSPASNMQQDLNVNVPGTDAMASVSSPMRRFSGTPL